MCTARKRPCAATARYARIDGMQARFLPLLLLSFTCCFAEPPPGPATDAATATNACAAASGKGAGAGRRMGACKAALQRRSRPAQSLVTVTLADGSVLHGALRRRVLPAVAPAVGRIRIDLAKVERIEFLPSDFPAGPSAEGARNPPEGYSSLYQLAYM